MNSPCSRRKQTIKGEITEGYISERVRVGEVHANINLPLKTT
jgi:hypothetical protein